MTTAPAEVFAIDLAQLAREIACDIFPIEDVLRLHDLSDEEWSRIQDNPRFKTMFEQMVREWNSAANTRERIRIKAATGLESQLEVLIAELSDSDIPYTQRIEGAKFLARVGEIEAEHQGQGGAPFAINITIGDVPAVRVTATPPMINVTPAIPEE